MNAALGNLQHILKTHARGPAMSARELSAAGEVLGERTLDILIALKGCQRCSDGKPILSVFLNPSTDGRCRIYGCHTDVAAIKG